MKLKDIKLFEEEEVSFKTLGITYNYPDVKNFFTNFKGLTTFVGTPERIYGDFYCADNKFTNFKGFPQKIDGSVYCVRNDNPVDFTGMPVTEIKGGFVFGVKHEYQLKESKNFSQLFKSLKSVKMVEFGNKEFENMFNMFLIGKISGEDLDELLVEGMDWCTDHGYPEEFWGDIE